MLRTSLLPNFLGLLVWQRAANVTELPRMPEKNIRRSIITCTPLVEAQIWLSEEGGTVIQTPLEKCIRFADRQQSPMEIIPENLFPFLNRDGLSQQFLIRGVKGKKWLGDDYLFFTETKSSSVYWTDPRRHAATWEHQARFVGWNQQKTLSG